MAGARRVRMECSVNRQQRQTLDRHITGNYGKDQFNQTVEGVMQDIEEQVEEHSPECAMCGPRIVLTNDGTMDTVLRCRDCGQELRYNYDRTTGDAEQAETYDEFVKWAIEDAGTAHECGVGV